MSIKWKILLPMLFLAVLGIACAAVIGFRSLTANERTTEAFTDAISIINAADTIDRQAKIANAELDALLEMSRMIDFDTSWETFLAASDQISAEIDMLSRLSQNEALVAVTGELAAHHAAWREKAEAFYGKLSGRTSPVVEALRRDQAGMSAAIIDLGDISTSSAEQRSEALSAEVRAETLAVIAVSSLLIAAAILLALRGAMRISADVRSITTELNEISGAETAASALHRSEIAQIGEATERLKTSLEEKERLEARQRAEELERVEREREAEKRAEEQRRKETEDALRQQQAEQERERELADIQARAAAEREEAAKRQEHVVASLAAGLKRLASGDLGSVIETRFDGPYETLREDFNQAVTQLSELVSNIRERGAKMEHSTAEVVTAARVLSQRTERTASRVTGIASNLGNVSNVLSETVSTLGNARVSATRVNEKAKESGDIVAKTVEAVSQIEKSSSDIEQIVSVIDDIAFQTNLLALNAGVEAARAGEAGRGFAVVASEVRALSQRSADAAREIGDLISRARVHVQEGAERTSETGRLFEVLVADITEVHAAISQIDQGAKQQRDSLKSVSSQTHEIDSDIQKNAAMFEETTAATTTMQDELEDLNRSVAVFEVLPDQSEPAPKDRAA